MGWLIFKLYIKRYINFFILSCKTNGPLNKSTNTSWLIKNWEVGLLGQFIGVTEKMMRPN